MNDLDTNMEEIMHKQQILEHLKADCQDEAIVSQKYAQQIIANCRPKSSPVQKIIKIPAYLFIAVFTVYLFAASALMLLTLLLNLLPASRSADAFYNAEQAIKKGNYDTARDILEKLMEEEPKDGHILPTYAELCQLEGRHDEAAQTLIDFLNNVIGTQNIQSGNGLYTKLKELTGPFSPDVEKACHECIAACEESIDNFNRLDTLMKDEDYQTALRLCDSMRLENVSDYYICSYYFICYEQLGKHEECAAYCLDLTDKWQSEDGDFFFQLPLKSTIKDKLIELKPYVTETTQEQIDAACLLLDENT